MVLISFFLPCVNFGLVPVFSSATAIVGSSTSSAATGNTVQSKTFFDGLDYFFWFWNGSYYVSRSSADGLTWSSETAGPSLNGYNPSRGGLDIVWDQGTSGSFIYAMGNVYGGGTAYRLYFQKASINLETNLITWGNPVTVDSDNEYYVGGGIAISTTGRLWIAYHKWDGKDVYGKYSDNNGTNWSSTTIDNNFVISSTTGGVDITHLPDGDMLAIVKSTTDYLWYSVYTSSWSSLVNMNLQLNSGFNSFSLMSDDNGVAHLTYIYADGSLAYQSFSSGAWSSESEIDSATVDYATVSVENSTENIFWIKSDVVYRSEYVDGSWSSPDATFGTSFVSPTYITSSNTEGLSIGVMWTEGDGSPYSVMSGLRPPPSTSPRNLEVTMSNSDGVGLIDYDVPLNSSGMVLLLHLDDYFNTFNVKDDSGNSNEALLNGDGDEWVSRPLSKAILFDGVDDYINVTDHSSLNLNDTFTIEAWFKTDVSHTGTIVMKYNSTLGQSNYRLWITGDGLTTGYLTLNVYDGTNDLFVRSPSGNYADNVWHHVVGQWERGDAAYLWMDGILVNSTADTITDPVINNWTLTIGIDNDFTSNPFDGFLDEIRIYNRVLNVTELTYSWVHGEAHYDNYVYANEDYYSFEGVYSPYWAGEESSVIDVDTVMIGFFDGWHWMNVSYDVADDVWSLLGNSSDYITLKRGTSSYAFGEITVTFPIYFTSNIIDELNVDIYMWCNNTDGDASGWELKAVDYFHIYNLGGQAEYASFGDAGRIVGGDVLEIYANNASWVQANVTFRKLQSVHLYVRVEGNKVQWDDEEGDPKNITFGMYVAPDGDDVWIEGWKVVLEQVDGGTWIGKDWLGQRAFYIVWNASWYYKTNGAEGWNHIISDTFSSFPVWNGTTNFYTSLWIDFWFNKINGSRLVGGRVNSEYFGIYNTASVVIFGWGTNFEAYLGNVTQSMFFHNLENDSGDVISSKQIKLMKFYARVEQGVNAARDFAVTLRDYDILSFRIAPNQMEGIDTPIFVASKMPSMPSTGFLEALFGGFTIMGRTISEAITLGALWGWKIFVDFLDSVAGMLGSPNFFSTLFSQIAGFGGWMVSSLGYLVTLVTSFFGLVTASMGKFLTLVTSIFSGWVDIFQAFINVIDDGFNTGFNIYTDYIAIWMPLVPVGMLIYFYFRLAEDGIDAVYRDLQMIFSVLSLMFTFFITIIQVTLNIISTIIESIPVVE